MYLLSAFLVKQNLPLQKNGILGKESTNKVYKWDESTYKMVSE